MARVFISYRREDSAEYAQSLVTALGERIPPEAVFLDVESIEGGGDFGDVIFSTIEKCDLMVILISPAWTEAIMTPPAGKVSWILMEVETALRLGKMVLPVVIHENSNFYEANLPPSILKLRERNCMEVPHATEEALDSIAAQVRYHLEQAKEDRIERLARKIAKPPGAIKHVWETMKSVISQGAENPGPEELWDGLIELAQQNFGERKWRRVLKNYRLTRSEDLGMVIFACIIEGYFTISDTDDPSDYWGLGSIEDI